MFLSNADLSMPLNTAPDVMDCVISANIETMMGIGVGNEFMMQMGSHRFRMRPVHKISKLPGLSNQVSD